MRTLTIAASIQIALAPMEVRLPGQDFAPHLDGNFLDSVRISFTRGNSILAKSGNRR
jgi:hypothetical protein